MQRLHRLGRRANSRRMECVRRWMRPTEAMNFGAYRLHRRIGIGGMAEVFLATERARAEAGNVALKRMLPELAHDAACVRMFWQEAQLARKLVHPHIVPTRAVGAVAGVPFLVMEHIDGADLRCVLDDAQQPPMHVSEVVTLGQRVAHALAYVHQLHDTALNAMHLVHRDVSPHNILLSRTGHVYLSDFGIAKPIRGATQTAHGVLKGKLIYMAPEQAAGEAVTDRSDQFALALVLWECLSGRAAYTAGAEKSLASQARAGQVPPIRQLRPDVSCELEQVLRRALAPDPAARFASMQAFAAALARCADDGTERLAARVQARTRTPAATTACRNPTRLLPRVRPRRRGPRLALAAAVVCVALGTGMRLSARTLTDARAATKSGVVSLHTVDGAVDVYHGLRKLGTTPLQNITLPGGLQRLRLLNPAAGVDQWISVWVEPDTWMRHTLCLDATGACAAAVF